MVMKHTNGVPELASLIKSDVPCHEHEAALVLVSQPTTGLEL